MDESVLDASNNRIGIVDRKRVQLNLEQIETIPFHRRTNIRSLSAAIQVPKSTLHRCIQKGQLQSHTNAIKPFLTEENNLKRLAFMLNQFVPESLPHSPIFKDFSCTIHVDEKWFEMSKQSLRVYKTEREREPHRTSKSKAHIPKLMHLCAVGRPIFGPEGEVIWAVFCKQTFFWDECMFVHILKTSKHITYSGRPLTVTSYTSLKWVALRIQIRVP
ncbi:hypothetical protein DM860_005819 [Cuscuta australis]|uniref:Transposase Tc1-like domain-containing protein n=1 Tax=Cuscuta australis TaxID=267555 RepID=A0A328DRT2_9ASTE|nr:hypothetical protein DM860_005819 [Cuscuta australis]